MYDPWQHAATLGLSVRHVPSLETLGLYADGEIWIRSGLAGRVERCVLAHEVAHAIHGHEPTNDPVLYARNERAADRHAARHLIDEDDLRRSAAATNDIGMWALELDVTGWILQARLEDMEKVGALWPT